MNIPICSICGGTFHETPKSPICPIYATSNKFTCTDLNGSASNSLRRLVENSLSDFVDASGSITGFAVESTPMALSLEGHWLDNTFKFEGDFFLRAYLELFRRDAIDECAISRGMVNLVAHATGKIVPNPRPHSAITFKSIRPDSPVAGYLWVPKQTSRDSALHASFLSIETDSGPITREFQNREQLTLFLQHMGLQRPEHLLAAAKRTQLIRVVASKTLASRWQMTPGSPRIPESDSSREL